MTKVPAPRQIGFLLIPGFSLLSYDTLGRPALAPSQVTAVVG